MRKNPPTKWPLPQTPDPPDRLCTVIAVPNDPAHIRAFLGAVYELSKPYAWGDDEAHTALICGRVWTEIFDALTIGDCLSRIGADAVQFRQNGCKLEYSIDCEHWNVLYDPTDCIAQISGQPGPGGFLAPGECKEYNVTLNANSSWLLPFPVSTNYTVEVTNPSGGWRDNVFDKWYCPDGSQYILGGCVPGSDTNSSDPIPTAPHMCLISKLRVVTPVYFESLTGVQTIGEGVSNAELEFQANDEAPSNDVGTIFFHVKVCNTNTPDTWCHEFDLTTGAAPTDLSFGAYGHFVENTGIVSDVVTGSSRAIVASLAFDARHITRVEIDVTFDTEPTGSGAGDSEFLYLNGSQVATIVLGEIFSGMQTEIWTGNQNADTLYMNPSGNTDGITITRIQFTGLGANPFGEDNCA